MDEQTASQKRSEEQEDHDSRAGLLLQHVAGASLAPIYLPYLDMVLAAKPWENSEPTPYVAQIIRPVADSSSLSVAPLRPSRRVLVHTNDENTAQVLERTQGQFTLHHYAPPASLQTLRCGSSPKQGHQGAANLQGECTARAIFREGRLLPCPQRRQQRGCLVRST